MIKSTSKSILLVEDEPILAMTEKMQLEKYGYTVKTITTGEKAVEATSTSSDIDLILMDINLGNGIDGTQAAQIILKDHDIPIVFLSSHTDPEVVEKTEKITSYGYVVKNSSITVLDASIKMAFKLFDANRKKNETIHLMEKTNKHVPGAIYQYKMNNDGTASFPFSTHGIWNIYELTSEQLQEDADILATRVHPDDLQRIVDSVHKSYATMETWECDFRVVLPVRGERWIRGTANPEKSEDGVLWHGYFTDITERKKLESDLVAQRKLYEGILEQSLAGYWDWDIPTGDEYLSPTFKKMFGYEDNEIENRADSWQKLIVAEDLPGVYEKFNLHVESKGKIPFYNEVRYRHKNGSTVWVICTGKVMEWDADGKAKRMIGCHIDITERKRNEERFNFALEGSNLGEWDWDYKTGKVIRNPRWAEMLGYFPEEIDATIAKTAELQHPDDIQIVQKTIKEHFDGITDHYAIEYRLKMKNGNYKWIRDCGKIMERDSDGKPLRICGTHADIDTLKNSDRLISESNHMLNSILDSSPDVVVFALDTNYKYLAFNSKHKEVIKSIWGKDISIGTNMLDVIGNHEDSVKAKESFDRALRGESFVIVEEYGDEKLSRQSWLDYWSPIKSLDGTIIGLNCFLMNNTKQKMAQVKIESLLAEKELILREVHHRIKNNMNTVSGLLSLQASTIAEPVAIMALTDAGNRIQSMSLLYDKLYRSTDYTELSVKEYLSSLVDAVIANFSNSQIVKVKKDIQDFSLDVGRLQPLGIIIYELITNIMKYAFLGAHRGLITISAVNTSGHIMISVQDDGIGIPETVSFENSTGFGLQLVHALAQQLNGRIRIERGNGTRFIVELDA